MPPKYHAPRLSALLLTVTISLMIIVFVVPSNAKSAIVVPFREPIFHFP